MSASQETPRLQKIRQGQTTIRALLDLIFPDPSPDILTLETVRFTFKLRDVNAAAINAIKQAQRINRAIGNHRQTGLCEFHVGLIYLDWGDCLAAGQQFAEARRQWTFGNDVGAVCLAHFAEGQAHYFAYHYETAMTNYGKAEQCLLRIPYTPPSDGLGAFMVALEAALRTAQQAVRDGLWALKDENSTSSAQSETATQVMETAVSPPPPPPNPVPPPHYNPNAPEGINPVPGHTKDNEQYNWYQVQQLHHLRNNLFPGIPEGAWLLVQRLPENSYPLGGVVVVIFDREVNNGILVKPHQATHRFRRIYLARWEEPMQRFTRDIHGTVTFSPDVQRIPITPEEVLGIVRGAWLEMVLQQ